MCLVMEEVEVINSYRPLPEAKQKRLMKMWRECNKKVGKLDG
jgi:hypothetical protein